MLLQGGQSWQTHSCLKRGKRTLTGPMVTVPESTEGSAAGLTRVTPPLSLPRGVGGGVGGPPSTQHAEVLLLSIPQSSVACSLLQVTYAVKTLYFKIV